MLGRKKAEKILEPVDLKTGIDLLQEQIEAAKKMLADIPIQSKDHKAWNEQTKACLIQIYGERSPNIDTITEASGTTPVWLFMPDDVAERHAASCLEDKLQRLESCVVALKRKVKESQFS